MPDHPPASVSPSAMTGTVRAGLWMIGFTVTFAVLMAMVRHVSAEIHPIEVPFFRNFFALVVMLPWFARVGFEGLKTRRLGVHGFRALSGVIAMCALFTAVSLMPLAEVTALTFTSPLFATAGAALVLGETVRVRRWTATVVGFAGTLIILRPGIETLTPAAMIALLAAAFIATSMLSIKSLSATESPNVIVLYMGLLMTPMSLVPALFVWTWPTLEAWAWLAAIGVVATLGQLAVARAFAAADASAVMPFDFFRLVFTAALGFALFGESLDVWTWVGAGVILASSVYIARREARLGKETPAPLQ